METVGPKLGSLDIGDARDSEIACTSIMRGLRKCTRLKSLSVSGSLVIHLDMKFWRTVGKDIGKNIEKLEASFHKKNGLDCPAIFDEIM